MNKTAMAHRIALKAIEKITPSEHLKSTRSSDPEGLIMQRDKVIHSHYDLPSDVSIYENKPEYDDVSFLVRYLVEDDGTKKKKDSF